MFQKLQILLTTEHDLNTCPLRPQHHLCLLVAQIPLTPITGQKGAFINWLVS